MTPLFLFCLSFYISFAQPSSFPPEVKYVNSNILGSVTVNGFPIPGISGTLKYLPGSQPGFEKTYSQVIIPYMGQTFTSTNYVWVTPTGITEWTVNSTNCTKITHDSSSFVCGGWEHTTPEQYTQTCKLSDGAQTVVEVTTVVLDTLNVLMMWQSNTTSSSTSITSSFQMTSYEAQPVDSDFQPPANCAQAEFLRMVRGVATEFAKMVRDRKSVV